MSEKSSKAKLTEEELIDKLDTMLICACYVHKDNEEVKEEVRQAYKQLMELIQQKPRVSREQIEELADSLQYDLQPSDEPNLDIKDIVKSLMKRIPTDLGVEVTDDNKSNSIT